MNETLNARLQGLRAELAKGRERLQSLQHQELQTRETVLRIEGAIAVLSEMLEELESGPAPASALRPMPRDASA